jgi:hypothetical protein
LTQVCLGLVNVIDPLLLGSDNILDSRCLGLKIMSNSSFLGLESCLALFFFFCNGQHNFLGGERAKREEEKKSCPELLHGPPQYTRLATMPRVARRIERHPVRWLSILLWACMCHPNGVGGWRSPISICPTRQPFQNINNNF